MPSLTPLPVLVIAREVSAGVVATLQGRSEAEMPRRFEAGHRAYVALMDGRPAAWGWVATRTAEIGELGSTFAIPPGGALPQRARPSHHSSELPMSDSVQVAPVLLNGAVGGALTVLVAYALPRFTRQILAAVLVVAALFYIAFAYGAQAGSLWLAAELLGVLVYGGMAVRGVRGSPWWLVAGWTLHPVWDVALHYVGPGRAFAPEWYTIACLSWDLTVAGYVAYRLTRGSRLPLAAG